MARTGISGGLHVLLPVLCCLCLGYERSNFHRNSSSPGWLRTSQHVSAAVCGSFPCPARPVPIPPKLPHLHPFAGRAPLGQRPAGPLRGADGAKQHRVVSGDRVPASALQSLCHGSLFPMALGVPLTPQASPTPQRFASRWVPNQEEPVRTPST